MILSNEILNQWKGTPKNYFKKIDSVMKDGLDAWGIVLDGKFGVAIPNSNEVVVDEGFSEVEFVSQTMIIEEEQIAVLMLMSENPLLMEPFSFLCAEFVRCERRDEITQNPLVWWQQWKSLVGNKNVDEMVHDTLGELVALYYLASHGEAAEWNGPLGATYDIDCGGKYVEVKSTKSRNKKEITLNNEFQLQPPVGSNLKIAFCQFEDANVGISINKMVDLLANIGYDKTDLNKKLRGKGLRENKSDRNKCYMLHMLTFYNVDDAFPAIRSESFVGGAKPVGVQSYTYTVSLDGVVGEQVYFQEDDKINEIQNN